MSRVKTSWLGFAPAVFVCLSGFVAFGVVIACAETSARPLDPDEDVDATTDGRDADAALLDSSDANAPRSTCAITRDYVTACNQLDPDGGEPLTCGEAKFDAWCARNDAVMNSAAYRRAEAQCLDANHCDGAARRDCEYKTYATAMPTKAQADLVTAYCQSCEPSDPTGCRSRKIAYDPAAGPKSTDDVFVAAEEPQTVSLPRTAVTISADPPAAPNPPPIEPEPTTPPTESGEATSV